MLTKPTIESLLPKTENRYVLSMLTAKRARQLVDGAQPMIDSKTENVVSLAAEEIDADMVKAVKGKVEVTVPLRPEVEAERLSAELEAEAKKRESKNERRFNERNDSYSDFRQNNTEENDFNRVVAEQLLNSIREHNLFDNGEE